MLYAALKFLEGEENKEDLTLVTSRWQKVEGRGRPRRMYKLNVQEYPDMSSLTFQTLVEWSTFALRFQK